MNILIAGRLSEMPAESFQPLAEKHNVILASEDGCDSKAANAVAVTLSSMDPEFEGLLQKEQMDCVLLFAPFTNSEDRQDSALAALEHCLHLCEKHEISRVMYCYPVESSGTRTGLTVRDQACVDLCSLYSGQTLLQVTAVALPVVYGLKGRDPVLSGALQQAAETASVCLPGKPSRRFGMLAADEFARILLRLCEQWPEDQAAFQIPACEICTLEKLAALIGQHYPGISLSYTDAQLPDYGLLQVHPLLSESYGWRPERTVEQSVPLIVQNHRDSRSSGKKRTLGDRFFGFSEKHPAALQAMEVILGYLLLELVLFLTDSVAQFRYIDFRLAYVLALATMHGLRTGLWAALLASCSLAAAMIREHSAWYAVAYDFASWMPVMILFLIGAIAGYCKNRYVAENRMLIREKKQLSERYERLNSYYDVALKRENQFKTQILSYENSFGKLYEMAENLDSTLVEDVCAEAIPALEGILNNHTVSIYEMEKNASAGWLVACSREIFADAEKTLKMADYPLMVKALENRQIWVNRSGSGDYPDYAYPVYAGNALVTVIVVHRASFEQMSLYYENMVTVTCGMVKIALLRAMEFTRHTGPEMYLPGTVIYNREHFSHVLAAEEKMVRNGSSIYSLVRLDVPKESWKDTAMQISAQLHATDSLGEGNDGNLYLLLSQMNRKNAQLVLMRIQNHGVPLRVANLEEHL